MTVFVFLGVEGASVYSRHAKRRTDVGRETVLFEHEAVVLFLGLFALYSPVAALSSYLPIVRPSSPVQQLRLAVGLVVNVAVFVLLAIWVGEPLLKLLGISTAALTATGGIALLYAAIPLMRGVGEPAAATEDGDAAGAPEVAAEPASPRSVLFTPVTFPLTVGGTTFAFGVAASERLTGTPLSRRPGGRPRTAAGRR